MSYERARGLTAEEENRLHEYRNQLKSTVEQLYELECKMNMVNKDMFEEKRRVAQEIHELGYTKQNVQSQLFMIAEAQKRLSKEGLCVSSTSKNSNSISNQNAPILLGGRNLPSPLLRNTQSNQSSGNRMVHANQHTNTPVDDLQSEIMKLRLQSASVLKKQ